MDHPVDPRADKWRDGQERRAAAGPRNETTVQDQVPIPVETPQGGSNVLPNGTKDGRRVLK